MKEIERRPDCKRRLSSNTSDVKKEVFVIQMKRFVVCCCAWHNTFGAKQVFAPFCRDECMIKPRGSKVCGGHESVETKEIVIMTGMVTSVKCEVLSRLDQKRSAGRKPLGR
jgi:hypothetical protein